MTSVPEIALNHPRGKRSKAIGWVLISMGAFLLLLAGSYLVFSLVAKAQLGRMEKVASPLALDTGLPPGWAPVARSTLEEASGKTSSTAQAPATSPKVIPPDENSAQPTSQLANPDRANDGTASAYVVGEIQQPSTGSASSSGLSGVVPGVSSGGSQGSAAVSYEQSDQKEPAIAVVTVCTSCQPNFSKGPIDPSSLRGVDPSAMPSGIGVKPPATRILIPAINVDSKATELTTVIEDGILVWQTPKWSVGYHRGTSNPGEVGNVVMSGHIGSPIRGEGSVFKRLPEISDLLGAGWKVDVITYTRDARYLYRVTKTEVVLPEQVDVMATTADPTLTLITCVPDGVYSHRLIVTAKLIATAPLEANPPPCQANNPYCSEKNL